MAPFLWICSASVPLLGAACFFKDTPYLAIPLVSSGIFVVLGAFGIGAYFAFRDPDRLHGDDHRLKTKLLDFADRKSGRVKVAQMDLVEMTNPYLDVKQIEEMKDAGPPAAPEDASQGSGDTTDATN